MIYCNISGVYQSEVPGAVLHWLPLPGLSVPPHIEESVCPTRPRNSGRIWRPLVFCRKARTSPANHGGLCNTESGDDIHVP